MIPLLVVVVAPARYKNSGGVAGNSDLQGGARLWHLAGLAKPNGETAVDSPYGQPHGKDPQVAGDREEALTALESLTDTLVERVDKLVQANKRPLRSTTPTTVAVGELAARIEALENAVREIALDVQKLAAQR